MMGSFGCGCDTKMYLDSFKTLFIFFMAYGFITSIKAEPLQTITNSKQSGTLQKDPWGDGTCNNGPNGPQFYTKNGYQDCILNDESHNCPIKERSTMSNTYSDCFICCWGNITERPLECPTTTLEPLATPASLPEKKKDDNTGRVNVGPIIACVFLLMGCIIFCALCCWCRSKNRKLEEENRKFKEENRKFKEDNSSLREKIEQKNPVPVPDQQNAMEEGETIRNDDAASKYKPESTLLDMNVDTNDLNDDEQLVDEGIDSRESSSYESINMTTGM